MNTSDYNSSNKKCNTENQTGHSYTGTVDRFSFGNGKKALVVFSNPKSSGVTITMNQISASNLCSVPLVYDVYCSTRVAGNVTLCSKIFDCNLCSNTYTNAMGRIYCGTGDVQPTNRHMLVHTLNSYYTHCEKMPYGIILPPGTNHVYVFDSLTAQAAALASMTFVWYEEPSKQH